MPKVSVIIPTFNRAGLLPQAVNSVLHQSMTDFELIVVDDGSTDSTAELIGKFVAVDHRVKLLVQENRGLPAARNVGIGAATGEYIGFLDSDDVWTSDKLEEQLKLFSQNSSLGVAYCDWKWIDDSGLVSEVLHSPEVSSSNFFESLLYFNIVHGSASAVLVKQSCFYEVGTFDEILCSFEDWDMWIRLASKFEFAKAPKALVFLRRHDGQMQRKSAVMASSALKLVDKISAIIPIEMADKRPVIRWHHYLLASELFCGVQPAEARYAWWAGIHAWPKGLKSIRTWYVLILSCSGPLLPFIAWLGVRFRPFLRKTLGLNAVTGFREN